MIYIIAFGVDSRLRRQTMNVGHYIGGLAAGFAIGYVAGTPVHSSPGREGMWRVLGAACILLTVWSFFLVYRNFPAPDQLR